MKYFYFLKVSRFFEKMFTKKWRKDINSNIKNVSSAICRVKLADTMLKPPLVYLQNSERNLDFVIISYKFSGETIKVAPSRAIPLPGHFLSLASQFKGIL